MTYYQVQIFYTSKPRATLEEASMHLGIIEAQVEKTLDESGLVWRHAYSWPDGSCYKWVKSDMDVGKLYPKMLETFAPIEGFVDVSITEDDPLSDPYKMKRVGEQFVDVKTLQEYFEDAATL